MPVCVFAVEVAQLRLEGPGFYPEPSLGLPSPIWSPQYMPEPMREQGKDLVYGQQTKQITSHLCCYKNTLTSCLRGIQTLLVELTQTCCSSIWMRSWSLLLLSSLSLPSLSHSIILSCRRPLSRAISCWNKAMLPAAWVWVRVGPADARPFDSFNFWHKPLTYSSLLESYFCHFEFKLSTWDGKKTYIYDVNRKKWHDIFQEYFYISVKCTEWHFLTNVSDHVVLT